MRRYRVVHTTTYRYQSKVSLSYGQLCVLPREFDGQRCMSSQVEVMPAPGDTRQRVDFFGNRVAYFAVETAHDTLEITADSEVEVSGPRPGRFDEPAASRSTAEAIDALADVVGEQRVETAHYRLDSPRITTDERVHEYAHPSFDDDRPVIEALQDLFQRIHRDFSFDPKATSVSSTIDDLFEHGAGVCQDFAHLAVGCLRSQSLPARYVSGYLETIPPPGKKKIVGADVSHAWVDAFVPDLGWVGIDPTNDQFVNDRYITTAWGRDYGDVSPLKGVIFSNGGKTELDVSVDVRPL